MNHWKSEFAKIEGSSGGNMIEIARLQSEIAELNDKLRDSERKYLEAYGQLAGLSD